MQIRKILHVWVGMWVVYYIINDFNEHIALMTAVRFDLWSEVKYCGLSKIKTQRAKCIEQWLYARYLSMQISFTARKCIGITRKWRVILCITSNKPQAFRYQKLHQCKTIKLSTTDHFINRSVDCIPTNLKETNYIHWENTHLQKSTYLLQKVIHGLWNKYSLLKRVLIFNILNAWYLVMQYSKKQHINASAIQFYRFICSVSY